MERWEIISGELEADLSRPLERLGFGRVFISDHRTASQLLSQREAARMVPNFAQPEPIILAYGTVTCASAQVPRNLAGAWLHAQCAPQIKINVDYLLDPTKKYIVSQGNLY